MSLMCWDIDFSNNILAFLTPCQRLCSAFSHQRPAAEMLTGKKGCPQCLSTSVSYVRCSGRLLNVLLRLLQTYKVLMLKGLQKRRPAHHFGILIIFGWRSGEPADTGRAVWPPIYYPKSRSSNSMRRVPSLTRKIRMFYWCRTNLYKPPAKMNWIIH